MMIFWIKRTSGEGAHRDENAAEQAENFREHNERMKQFSVSHPRIEPPKPEKVSETGMLVPYRRIKLDSYICN